MAPGNSRVAAESLLDSYASRHDEWARGFWLALLPGAMKKNWGVTGAKPPPWFRIEKCSIQLLRELWERGFTVCLPPEYDHVKKILGMSGDESGSESDSTSTTTSESSNHCKLASFTSSIPSTSPFTANRLAHLPCYSPPLTLLLFWLSLLFIPYADSSKLLPNLVSSKRSRPISLGHPLHLRHRPSRRRRTRERGRRSRRRSRARLPL